MNDLALQLMEAEVDLALQPGDLERNSGLQNAILLSLFCDARAADLPAGVDPRGWWGNEAGDEWGSRLWLLTREVASEANALSARQYAEAALEWMVEDGVAGAVTVEAEYSTGGTLELTVAIARGNAPEWQHLWDEVKGQFQFPGTTLAIVVV